MGSRKWRGEWSVRSLQTTCTLDAFRLAPLYQLSKVGILFCAFAVPLGDPLLFKPLKCNAASAAFLRKSLC